MDVILAKTERKGYVMSNSRRKTFFGLISIFAFFVAILTVANFTRANSEDISAPIEYASMSDSEYVFMTVVLNEEALAYAGTYKVSGGEEIKVSAFSENADICFVAYYYEKENDSEEEKHAAYENRTKIYESDFSIIVPELEEGERRILWIEAVDEDDDGTPNVVNKTGWQAVFLEWEKEETSSSVDAENP